MSGEDTSNQNPPAKPVSRHHPKPSEERSKEHVAGKPPVKHHPKLGEESSEEQVPEKPPVKRHAKPDGETSKEHVAEEPSVKHHAKPGEESSKEQVPEKPPVKHHAKPDEGASKEHVAEKPPVKRHANPDEETSIEHVAEKPSVKHNAKPDEETSKAHVAEKLSVKYHAKRSEELSEEQVPGKPPIKRHAKPDEETSKEHVAQKPPVKHHAKTSEELSEEHVPQKPSLNHHPQTGGETSKEQVSEPDIIKHVVKRRGRRAKVTGSSMWSRFAYNLIVGLVAYYVAMYVAKTGTGEELGDKSFDVLTMLETEWFSNRSLSVSDAPVYFIVITDDDHKRWKDHDTTSRDNLARLVDAAYEKDADVVVVDALFDKPANGDEALRKAFCNFTSHRRANRPARVILPTRINHDGNIDANIFDDLISRYPQNFLRGLAYIEATGSKALVRYWTPYLKARTADGQEETVWGIPALAATMTAEKDKRLTTEERDFVFSQRIRYRLMPETRSTLRITMPAGELESAQKNPLPSLKGKIVLIGNTSPDMTDTHRTPVGELPGIYILGNAINTVLYGLRAPILPRTVAFLLQFAAILVAAVAFTHYTSNRAYLVTVAIYFITLVPVGSLIYLTEWDLYHFMLPVIAMRLRMEFVKVQLLLEKLHPKRILRLLGWRKVK